MKALKCLVFLFLLFQTGDSKNTLDPVFIKEISQYYSRYGTVVYLPSDKKTSTVHFQKQLERIEEESVRPRSYIYQSNGNDTSGITIAKEDLHVFVIDPDNLKTSIKLLSNMIGARDRTRREYWLVDITAVESIEKAEMMLAMMKMDLDDDIFLYLAGPDQSMHIWEVYKIKPNLDLITRKLGTWSRQRGFNMTSIDKWKRRGDLTVSKKYVRRIFTSLGFLLGIYF